MAGLSSLRGVLGVLGLEDVPSRGDFFVGEPGLDLVLFSRVRDSVDSVALNFLLESRSPGRVMDKRGKR